MHRFPTMSSWIYFRICYDMLNQYWIKFSTGPSMTKKRGNRGRGNNIGKYIPYNNFPAPLREGTEGRGEYLYLFHELVTMHRFPTMSSWIYFRICYDMLNQYWIKFSTGPSMTEKRGNRGRGNNIGKYLPYSNFPAPLREGTEGRGRSTTNSQIYNEFH